MDVFSDALREIRLRSALYRRFELTSPWSLLYPAGGRGVHVVSRGRCELMWPDDNAAAIPLETGDLVVMPAGHAHVIRSLDARKKTPISVEKLLGEGASCPVVHGGRGESTTLVCGKFLLDDTLDDPAFRSLPRAILLPGDAGAHDPNVAPLLVALVHEVTRQAPGAEVVVARLSDAIVVHALRRFAASEAASGWLAALYDEQLRGLLEQLHQRPEQGWTVESMAAVCGMSRAAFAGRFSEKMGESPVRYLTRIRMRRAQTLLAQGRLTMFAVAEAIGYTSEAAFSVAFRRWVGVPPATFRRRARGEMDASSS